MNFQDDSDPSQAGALVPPTVEAWVVMDPDTGLGELARQMRRSRSPVAWIRDQTGWLGSIRERALLDCILADPGWEAIPARELMSRPVMTYPATADRDPELVRALMEAEGLDYLPIVDETGSLVEVLTLAGIQADCWAAQKAQLQTLGWQMNELKAMIDAVPGMVYQFTITEQGQASFSFLSKGVLELYDCTEADVQAHPLLPIDQIYAEDRPRVMASIQEAYSTLSPWYCEYRTQTLNGQVKWVLGKSRVYQSPQQGLMWVGVVWDIHQRKQAELKLEAQKELIESIANGIPGFIQQVCWDPVSETMTLDYLSQGVEAIIAVETAEMQANCSDWTRRLVLPEYLQAATTDFFQACMVEHRHYQTDIAIRNQANEIRWLRFCAQPHVYANGWIRVNSIVLDITENVLAQQAQQQSEECFRLLAENSTSLIMRHTLDGITLYASPASETIVGCTPEKMIGQVGFDFVHPEDVADLRLRLEELLTTKEKLSHQYRLRRQDSGYIWVETTANVIQNATGQVIEIQSSSRDVTQRVKTEQELRQTSIGLRYQLEVHNARLQEALKYESLLRTISHQVRSSLNEREVIQHALEELGRGLGLNGSYFSYVTEDLTAYVVEQEWAIINHTLVGGSYPTEDGVMRQAMQGQTLYYCVLNPFVGWITLLTCPIALDDLSSPPYFLSLSRDRDNPFVPGEIRLAEQVANQCAIAIRQARLYQQSQQQVQKLQELNQMKEDFIHTISHELRTPLTSMKMALTLLKMSQTDAQREKYHQILEFEWNRELALVNELLELQALESGTRAIILSCISLTDWIPSVVSPFQLRCQDREQQFDLVWDPDLKTLTTDQFLLERVLAELLNNACKYTPPGDAITLSIVSMPVGIQFQISNSGVTIPADQLSAIFEKFHRIPRLDRYNQGGTGLGLALVKKVVEVLRGTLSVESEANITTFTVQLPSLTP
ncbi:MAG: PAS domain-containing protein [Synechococcaceae cyanobacterium SM2_3_2]|nr:PAS domain-containing protein [Synechococcaceae cyanobacterium SM2_3_2]